MLGVGTYPSSHPPSQPPSLPSSPNSENPARAKGVAWVNRGGWKNAVRKGEEESLSSRCGREEEEDEEEKKKEEREEEEEKEVVAEEEEKERGKGMQSGEESGARRGAPPRVEIRGGKRR